MTFETDRQETGFLFYVIPTEYIAMPSKSPKQARTMRAAEHNPAFRKKMHIPLKVAKEFNRADARKGKRK